MNPSADAPLRTSRRFGGRWLRPTLVCLGAWVALVVIFYAEEDWRGQRDWNRYRQAKEALGEHLEFRAYIPKPVPDAENFAETPIVKSWLSEASFFTNDLYARADAYVYAGNTKAVPYYHRRFMDLVAWQTASDALKSGELIPDTTRPSLTSLPLSTQHFETDKTDLATRASAAPAVLEGLKPDEADFTELRLASGRTHSRFPLQYDLDDPARTLLWHLAKIKAACLPLNLQACAELAGGETDKAAADVKLMLYLADSVKTEPFLLSFLVRAACFQIAVQPVWEGLAERRWTEAQLQELQARFQHYDFLADLAQSLKAERAFGILEVDQVKKKGLGLDPLANIEDIGRTTQREEFLNLVGRMMPAGWYELERLNYCTIFDAKMKGAMDRAAERVFPGRIASNSRQFPDQPESTSLDSILNHRVIAIRVLPFLPKMPIKAAVPQTAANQAAIACALERYRLAKGQFPEKLAALTPQYMSRLPHDVITGQPYKYRRTDDGQFILYSVGWNEKDDGGVPGKRLFDDKDGDWVWDYPVK
jgi:hypothetical protein